MPRDIRSYFAPLVSSQKKNNEAVSKSKKKRVISSDEDEEQPKSSIKRSKVKIKLKKSSILSDSEDDTVTMVKNEKNIKESITKKKDVGEKSYETVTLGDMFGTKPITRIEEPKVTNKFQKVESEFHDDDNFEAVLKQLDTSNKKKKKNLKQDTKKGKVSITNTERDISNNVKTVAKLEAHKNKKNKDSSLGDSYNKVSETKIKTTKSHNKNKNAHVEADKSSPLKRKLEKEKKDHSNSTKYFDNTCTADRQTNNVSKKLKNRSVSVSISKDKDTEEQISEKKKAKTVDLFEERIEKKKQRAISYEKYLHRGGARNPGSKEIPTGAKNCLAGINFLITGVLESLERNEAEDLIRSYGGRIVTSVSGKVNYIVVGDEAGPAKLTKAVSLDIEQLSEDDLLEMIRIRPEGDLLDMRLYSNAKQPKAKTISAQLKSDTLPLYNTVKVSSISSKKEKTEPCLDTNTNLNEATAHVGSQSLVEKYRPTTMKEIIGQRGDRSCANNLYNWLRNWQKNRKHLKSQVKSATGQEYKAVLLSGPPGIGKTTTVQVVCKELGYDLLEFNASDTRNKTLLKEEVSGLLCNTTLKNYFTDNKQKITNKHVLLMDEVDGMAGNEDRGGLQELLNLIKYTEIPIIFICNDRYNTKVKTISYHAYDLKFPKLKVESIRSSMMSLCFKENINISTQDLDRLIESTNCDIRQVINHLEFLAGKTIHVEATDKKHFNKNFKLGPFDVAKIAFNAEKQKQMKLNDKIDLYFHDYNITPLFIQENYPNVKLPQMTPLQKLEKIANVADSISQGNLIEKTMRSNMMWSLLPMHACFSLVIPCDEMSGNLDSLVRFPTWFGRNSKAMKFNRLMQELTMHTRLVTGASKEAFNLDYLIHIRNTVLKPVIDDDVDGIKTAINAMEKYHLTREDLDSMIEVSLWPGINDRMTNLDRKMKTALTREYNKKAPMLPYAMKDNSTKKKVVQNDDDFMEGGEEDEEEEEENNDMSSDKMIKARNPDTNKPLASTKKTYEPTTKKRGRGAGKAK